MIAFEAEFAGPPRALLHIWTDSGDTSDFLSPPDGWAFAVSRFDECGNEQPWADHWEERFENIIRYPEIYVPGAELEWRRAGASAVVNLQVLVNSAGQAEG